MDLNFELTLLETLRAFIHCTCIALSVVIMISGWSRISILWEQRKLDSLGTTSPAKFGGKASHFSGSLGESPHKTITWDSTSKAFMSLFYMYVCVLYGLFFIESIMLCSCFLCKQVHVSCVFYNILTYLLTGSSVQRCLELWMYIKIHTFLQFPRKRGGGLVVWIRHRPHSCNTPRYYGWT